MGVKIMNQARREELQKIINTYGKKLQLIQAVEELSELQKAVCKYLKNPDLNEINNLTEEMADVQVMLDQLKIIFDNEKEVECNIEFKIKRTHQRAGIEE